MKKATDYTRSDGEGRRTITSLAHWLTPDGLSNSLIAKLLHRAIEKYTDEQFAEAFDGATKDEARRYLAAFRLCHMPYWGAAELGRAIHDADEGQDEQDAARAVALAQKAGELPDVFKPADGIKWAMDRGYMFGAHARFLGVRTGNYGSPHRPLSDGPNRERGEPQAAPVAHHSTPSKLTEDDKTEIVRRYNRGRGESVNKLAQQFGVSRPTIDKVLTHAGIKH